MTAKRRGLVAGGLLAGALLLGTAGLVAAQDPTTTPTANPAWGGAGVMGGQMGGQMNGQMGAGMMTPELLEQMDAIHDEMMASGGANHGQMEALHAQHHPTR